MKMKLALASATALGLFMTTAAFAGSDNHAYTSQDGSSNSASINQSGGTNNDVGTTSDAATQTGNGNTLTILQDGHGGQIGTATGTDSYYTPPSNLSVPQYTIPYHGVDQASSGSASNTASLTQHGSNQEIGEVQQNANSSANGNSLTVKQFNAANTINHIYQQQDAGAASGNVATATQHGSNNVIDRIDQKATGTGVGDNTITVDISGTGNGLVDTTGTGAFYSSRGWLAGATQSALIQNNYNSTGISSVSGNTINLAISGNNNQYGMTQKGTGNTTGLIEISGNRNSFGSYQSGMDNTIDAGAVQGSHNDIGIWQSGETNTGQIQVLASGSNYNGVSILQSGDSNYATVGITGSFNGDGMVHAGVARQLVSNNASLLSNGTIFQSNSLGEDGNHASLTIYGDNNDFAVASLGAGNTVTGTVGTSSDASDGNAAAVLQIGNTNTASFSQTGAGGNSVAINQ